MSVYSVIHVAEQMVRCTWYQLELFQGIIHKWLYC